MEDSIKMEKHVKVVGVIHLGFGIVNLICSMLLFVLFRMVLDLIPTEEIPEIVFRLITGVVNVFPFLLLLFGLLDIIGGTGLLMFKSWARYLILVVAAMGLLNIPIGTLKGVYTLWVLMQDETVKLFNKNP
jgi:hypothetical protein